MADRVPIKRAEDIAKAHGYHQVIIYARRVGEPGQEWVTTYGVDKSHCAAAARIGDAIGRQVIKPLEELVARAEKAEASQPRSQAAIDVIAERRRQIEAEGWTPNHDDEHGNGEMARAAASYALEHAAFTYSDCASSRLLEAARSVWPWGKDWWKPGAARRMLVKAGALILAEIERLDRKEGTR